MSYVFGPVLASTFTSMPVTLALPADSTPGIPNLGAYGSALTLRGSDGTVHRRMFYDMDGDGDVDADDYFAGNYYGVTSAQWQIRPRYSPGASEYGRLVIDNAGSLDGDNSGTVYIQSGLNYAGTTYADLAFTRYGSPGFHWGRFDESQNGYFILGKNAGQTAVARLHVYDGSTTVAFFEGNQTNTRITLKASGTASNTTVGIGATGDMLYMRAGATDVAQWTSTTLDMKTHKIVNVVDPTSAQDAATKNYVDVGGWAAAPASASAAGVAGQKAYDSNYLYICTAPNTWRRISHGTW
jgi:hypothetical protein